MVRMRRNLGGASWRDSGRATHLTTRPDAYSKGAVKKATTKTFLVLEDDADDAILIRRAFTNARCFAFVCRNTSEARAYLLGAGMYADRRRFPFPDIFVTDLRLGEESGLSFVAWVRSQEELKHLEVIVLSGTMTARDVALLRSMGVRGILAKPANPFDLEELLLGMSERMCLPHEPERVETEDREDRELSYR
jgi:CheY-like chemotaxis protein